MIDRESAAPSDSKIERLRGSAAALAEISWDMTRAQAELIVSENVSEWLFEEDAEGLLLLRTIKRTLSDSPFGISEELTPALYGPDAPLVRRISFDQTHKGTVIEIRTDPGQSEFSPANMAGVQLVEALLLEKGWID